jgi:hypothetical protein
MKEIIYSSNFKKCTRSEAVQMAQFLNEHKQAEIQGDFVSWAKLKNNNLRDSSHIKGDIAEYLAVCYFSEKGNLVFKNTSQHGLADLCVLDESGKLTLYDIKATSYKQNPSKNYSIISKPPTEEQKKCNVKILYFDVNTLTITE